MIIDNDVKTLQELIEIRDGYKECIGFTHEHINNITQSYALNNACFIYLFPFYIDMYIFILD